jgi:hypothetical protein
VDGRPEVRPTRSLTLAFRGDAEFDLAIQAFEFLAEKLSTVRQLSFKNYTPEYPELVAGVHRRAYRRAVYGAAAYGVGSYYGASGYGYGSYASGYPGYGYGSYASRYPGYGYGSYASGYPGYGYGSYASGYPGYGYRSLYASAGYGGWAARRVAIHRARWH